MKMTPTEGAAQGMLNREREAPVRAAHAETKGCRFCTHRVEGFGLVACSEMGNTYPACERKKGHPIKFDRDDSHEEVQQRIERNRADDAKWKRLSSVLGEERMIEIFKQARATKQGVCNAGR